jgi:nanoRNase/pAp phosphatase (c-di-AMP/oligoRNAs hydrolase)
MSPHPPAPPTVIDASASEKEPGVAGQELPGPSGLAQLREAAGPGPVLILTHDNPDPDALASGKALGLLLETSWGVPSRLAYSGLIARAENRVVLERLTPEWEHREDLGDLARYSAVALVDTQPGAGNNSLPASFVPHIVIDHHQPVREIIAAVRYADVRPDIGSTVTMLYQYLAAAGIEPDARLATAMFYGIKTDTRGLARGASPADEAVYLQLLARIQRSELIEVEQAGLERDYYRSFSQGLQSARIYGPALVSRLGDMHQPDMAAELADLLIRLQQAEAVLCMGQFNGTLHLSLRTKPLTEIAGQLIQRIIIPPGRAGGHRSMAGGQVLLAGRDPGPLMDEIEARFLAALNAHDPAQALLDE